MAVVVIKAPEVSVIVTVVSELCKPGHDLSVSAPCIDSFLTPV